MAQIIYVKIYGFSDIYVKHKKSLHERSKTSNKPPVSNWARAFLQEKLKPEYELYNIIKRIFYYKVRKLGFENGPQETL